MHRTALRHLAKNCWMKALPIAVFTPILVIRRPIAFIKKSAMNRSRIRLSIPLFEGDG